MRVASAQMQAAELIRRDAEIVAEVNTDLARTFPEHRFFASPSVPMSLSVRAVGHAARS